MLNNIVVLFNSGYFKTNYMIILFVINWFECSQRTLSVKLGLVIFHLKALSGDLVLSLNQLKLF